MKKDVLISITGTQRVDGEKDVVELTTIGSLYNKNGIHYLTYQEPDDSGYEGTRTTLKLESSTRVSMMRYGAQGAVSNLIVEKGVRHQCAYQTEYGIMTIGVLGDRIQNSMTDQGGSCLFQYTLDVNTALASENEVKILVKERQTEQLL